MMDPEPSNAPAETEPRTDVAAGMLFIVIGALGLFFSRSLSAWSAAGIESGFMPTLVSVLLVLFGAVVLVQGLRQRGGPMALRSMRPLLLVTACVLVSAVTLERFGLVVAIMLTVGIATFAGERPRVLQSLVVGAVLSFVCVAIFIWGAKLPLNTWPF